MLNKLPAQLRKYGMVSPGDRVICAVSGGADSMALLWSMYLLKDKLGITLEAVHFNHGLRGAESDRDEAFVREFCAGYDICCHVGRESVKTGKKGLEAAARAARYAFFETLDGKIATAHTADDNAETLLMHLVRGTGLKGLGGITPVNGKVIRPMLGVTRQEVLDFLGEYHVPYVQDSSNETDDFLRNRLRHHVMPLLKQENPRLVQNMTAMAMELRQDEEVIARQLPEETPAVGQLRQMMPAVRRRALAQMLQCSGVKEPERAHVELAEKLVFSEKPSAYADFPGGVRLCRAYDTILVSDSTALLETKIPIGQTVLISEAGLRVSCAESEQACADKDCFTVKPIGEIVLRSRKSGDKIRLSGGTKSLKKLFIDRKIPAHIRNTTVVVADDLGVLGVQGIGPNLDRLADSGIRINFEEI